MFISIFKGTKYSYSYEVETSHYLLQRNDSNSHICLQGDDVRIFRQEIEDINNLPPSQYNAERITEQLIGIFL
jgi:hypothetical protein